MKKILAALCTAALALNAGCGSDGPTEPPGNPDPVVANLGTMNVGDVRVLTFSQASGGLSIPAAQSSAQYVVVLSNVNTKSSTPNNYTVKGDWLPPSPAGSSDIFAPAPALATEPLHRNVAFEARLRQIERTQLPSATSRTSAAADRLAPSPRAVNAPPPVGSSLSIKVLNTTGFNTSSAACASNGFTTTTGVVRYNSAHATVVSDVNIPSGGFTAADYQSIGDEFDSMIYPADVNYFGTPTDLDNNGHIIIYYTPAVNQLTPANQASSSGYIGGFFFAGDLFDPVAGSKGCLSSNKAEVFYLLAPDPNAAFGNKFTTNFVRRVTRGTVAHEFQHMINSGNRYVNGYLFESTWLDEGLAHFAEDAVGRDEVGLGDTQKATLGIVSNIDSDTYAAFFEENFARAKYWVQRPDTVGAISSDAKAAADLAVRGAAWTMLRYVADWFNTGGDPRTTTKKLAAGPDTGVVNLTGASGVPLDTVLAHWLVTMYTDNRSIPNLPAQYNFKSYTLRDIITTTSIQTPSGNQYLPVPAIGNGTNSIPTSVPAASGAYFITSQTTGGARSVNVTGSGGANSADPNGRIYVIRTQ